ncbi:MAG: sugar phosphate nucleotidyltransferase [Candidatus Krumholzibacteriota bacterium]
MSGDKHKENVCGVILAAGHGERMKPITDAIPKPLIPVMGRPLFEILMNKLRRSGARSLHANIHHLPEAFFQADLSAGIPLEFHREDKILGTGGGIGNMRKDLENYDLILLHNADIISDIEYQPAIDFHAREKALVTMILAAGENGRNASGGKTLPPPGVYISDSARVMEIGAAPDVKSMAAGYTGMAVLSSEALEYFPPGRKAGLVEILRKMRKENNGSVAGYLAGTEGRAPEWAEIGTPPAYLDLHRRLMIDRTLFDPELEPPLLPLHVGPGARIGNDTRWKGFLEVGRGAVVGEGSVLENCVVLPETIVEKETEAEYSIFFPDGILKVGKT